jgi:anti-sigma B factor antagonist
VVAGKASVQAWVVPAGVEVMTVHLTPAGLRFDDAHNALICVAGEIDLATAGQFGDTLLAALTRTSDSIHLDMSGVEFMDTAGVHVLVAGQRRAALMGRHLGIVAPSRAVQRICGLAGLPDGFLTCDCPRGQQLPAAGQEAETAPVTDLNLSG